MQYFPRWLFQATPDRYDLIDEFKEGERVCWGRITHWNKPFRLGEDQRVIFFRAGSKELYGVGRILSVTKCLQQESAHTKNKGVDVLYDKRFFPPIPLPSKLPKLDWDDNRLPKLLTEGFRGTIFPLTPKDWSNLKKICPRLRTDLLDNYTV
jgi:hypothetical protein